MGGFGIDWYIKRAVFSPKVTIKEIKRKVSPFFLPPPVYLPFIALLSLWCCVGRSITR